MSQENERGKRQSYSTTEKAASVVKFDELRLAGFLATEAAADVGVPLSTLFRWKLSAKEAHLRSRERNIKEMIRKSFEVLYRIEDRSETDVLEALFVLVGWLRCSTKPEILDLSVATLLIAVARERHNVLTLDELPVDLRDTIIRHIRLSNFLDFCAVNPYDELVEFPTFWDDLLDDQPYDDRDELARMCWCLLALSNSPKHGPASLNKTMYLMNAGVFKYKWNVSRRTRDKLWRTHAPAAPFFYIERFHSPLEFSLKPQEPDFMLRVNDLLAAPKAIKEFLQRTFATIEQLTAAMDRRALREISFPQFPDDIVPLETQKPTLTSSIVSALRHYKSSEK